MISNAIVRDGRTGTTRAVLVTIVLVLAYPAGAQNGSRAGDASLAQAGQKPVFDYRQCNFVYPKKIGRERQVTAAPSPRRVRRAPPHY